MSNIPNMNGKIVVITGANSGIGYQTALEMARNGATVCLACRNVNKAEAAMASIKLQVPKADLIFLRLDLSDLSSVKRCARNAASKLDRIDILINNGGIMAIPDKQLTKDGFEMQIGTNHFGHFALTGLLLPLLLKSEEPRIVNLSSLAHTLILKFDMDNLDFKNDDYNSVRAYCNSKLANMLFSLALQKYIDDKGYNILVANCHPGISNTNLIHSGPKLEKSTFAGQVASWATWLFCQSEPMGALPTLYAATNPNVVKNGYYGPLFEFRGSARPTWKSFLANDEKLAHELWEYSQRKTGVEFV